MAKEFTIHLWKSNDVWRFENILTDVILGDVDTFCLGMTQENAWKMFLRYLKTHNAMIANAIARGKIRL